MAKRKATEAISLMSRTTVKDKMKDGSKKPKMNGKKKEDVSLVCSYDRKAVVVSLNEHNKLNVFYGSSLILNIAFK